ncbi:MAG: lytic transglycosylase domain-containing protein [Alphaproteobacteria bacterium]|nr:lytic transglycosylase domain-containing protein [Alphaproteobacteria bacterium]MBV9152837.1 lytic transglycosylase domain-containing protein [Alphaproteobacteria bacterium]
MSWRRGIAMSCVLVCCLSGTPAGAQGALESVDSAVCRAIENSARTSQLPIDFLTRVIWRESSFRAEAISTAGAQGIAQFMPETSRARGLADPFDPEQAIPNAAQLLADLQRRFGNLGLAAAAYAAGAARVRNWLHGSGTLSAATRAYVQDVTSRAVEEWTQTGSTGPAAERPIQPPVPTSCMQVLAELRRGIGVQTASLRVPSGRSGAPPGTAPAASAPAASATTAVAKIANAPATPAAASIAPGSPATTGIADNADNPPAVEPLAPWGVQLAGSFSKVLALASFDRARQRYAGLIEGMRPMVIGRLLRSRGTKPFYEVRLPAETRGQADALCSRIQAMGGACVALHS